MAGQVRTVRMVRKVSLVSRGRGAKLVVRA